MQKILKIKQNFLSLFFLKIIRAQKSADAPFSNAAFPWKIPKSVIGLDMDAALLFAGIWKNDIFYILLSKVCNTNIHCFLMNSWKIIWHQLSQTISKYNLVLIII